eukprot:TRINITY_DN7086_c0_g4_i1.p1 TRINITY_DN7086_c0_g4~~TRINITY_DN7086_c0_g4_i1.p1  ORF type:complete len:231 (-),score=65.24 TRINITY_DN7086_c0_g4_i1:54-722(-)
MIRRPPRSTRKESSAASDVYKRQVSTQSTWDTTMVIEVSECNQRAALNLTHRISKARKGTSEFSILTSSTPMIQLSTEDREVVASRAKMLELKNKLRANAMTYKKALQGEKLKPASKRPSTIPVEFKLRLEKRAIQHKKCSSEVVNTGRVCNEGLANQRMGASIRHLAVRTKILAHKQSNDKKVKKPNNISLQLGQKQGRRVRSGVPKSAKTSKYVHNENIL